MSTVSHNTSSMRNWSKDMDGSAENFDMLINRLYSLIDDFAGSKNFSGGLSNDFKTNVQDKKQKFLMYSTTFREASELVTKRAAKIDSDEAQLKSYFQRNNPLG